MALQDELRGNPLFQRQRSQSAFQSLRLNPLQFLRDTVITASAGNGAATTHSIVTPFAFNEHQNRVRIGISAIGHPGVLNVSTLSTQTRTNVDPNRLTSVQRFGANIADLWITDQQTGCTVLIVDWGLNQYSMAHLLPHAIQSYNRLSRGILNSSSTLTAIAKNKFLRKEATTITYNTLGRPLRYILIQSQHAVNNQNLVQVIGISNAGRWDFYLQESRATHIGFAASNAKQLRWRDWSKDWLYRSN